MVNDTISDMLTRLRNGNLAYKANVPILNTKVNRKICVILEREGFIHKVEESTNPTEFIVYLKYKRNPTQGVGGVGKPCITNLKRISKPGLRIYTNYREIPQILGGMGIVILSTSKGLMTDREARGAQLGGEVVCTVW
jgi:small subunit ribosomal protein S8